MTTRDDQPTAPEIEDRSGPKVVDDPTETIVPPKPPPELTGEDPDDEPEPTPEPEEELGPHEQRMAELRAELEDEPAPDPEDIEVEDGEVTVDDEGGDDEPSIEEDEDGELYLSLPNRQPDGEPIRLPVTVEALEEAGLDAESARERIAQLENGYARRSALRDERRAFEAERDEFYRAIEDDPADFIAQEINPETRKEVVQRLLAELDDESYTDVLRTADELADSDARTRAREKAELERRRKADEREKSDGDIPPEVRAISDAIFDLVPETMDDLDARDFVEMSGTRLKTYAKKHNLTELEPARIPDLLGELGVLDAFGLSGGDAGGSNGSEAPRKPADKAGGDEGGKESGTRSRLKRRQDSSRTTPAGAGGAAPQGFRPVKGETYLERRNRLAKSLGLSTKKDL